MADGKAASPLEAAGSPFRLEDTLGVAMEHSPSEGEEVVTAFVRWNHAVRREIHNEIDSAATSRNVGVFLDFTMTLAIVVVSLELVSFVLLTGLAASASRVTRGRHGRRDRIATFRERVEVVVSVVAALTILCQVLVFSLFLGRTPKRGQVVASVGAMVALGLAQWHLVTKHESSAAWARYLFNVAWQILGVAYFLNVYGSCKELQEDKAEPSWSCFNHPLALKLRRRLPPALLVAAVLLGVFLTQPTQF